VVVYQHPHPCTHRAAILAHPRIKLKEQHVRPVAEDKLFVYPPDDTRQGLLFSLEQLLTILPKVSYRGSAAALPAML
jgi:DNA-directed RNA polymerase III subunit RPC1